MMSEIDHAKDLQKAFNLHQSGELAGAAKIYRRILMEHPDHPYALHYLGIVEAAVGDVAQAKSLMMRSLAAQPTNIQFVENYATVLVQSGDYESALQICRQGLQLDPADISLLYAGAVALLKLERLQESLTQFDKLLSLQPNHIAAVNERGFVLAGMSRYDEALASFEQALKLEPRYADAHWNEALCRLLIGDFDRGWEKNEWRWEIGQARTAKRNFAQPQWSGREDIAGKTILLHAEQGFGDTIQFCRYVPLVAARGARVILEVQKPLHELMRTLSGAAQIVSRDDPLPSFDIHCPLLSLPLAFKTRLDTIPSNTPYLRALSPATMNCNGTGPRIGLAWSGRATQANDHNRSMELNALLPLLQANATFVSLQKDVRATDAPVLQAHRDLLHFGAELKDFSDTAALMSSLDLIISVDTSVAHLAGALAKPVWVLLAFNPDWRWLLDRDDSPWYPTARLFRQDDSRGWDRVVARVRVALHDYIQQR
jgi:tetratricopeptide (TPR) repeat protein